MTSRALEWDMLNNNAWFTAIAQLEAAPTCLLDSVHMNKNSKIFLILAATSIHLKLFISGPSAEAASALGICYDQERLTRGRRRREYPLVTITDDNVSNIQVESKAVVSNKFRADEKSVGIYWQPTVRQSFFTPGTTSQAEIKVYEPLVRKHMEWLYTYLFGQQWKLTRWTNKTFLIIYHKHC